MNYPLVKLVVMIVALNHHCLCYVLSLVGSHFCFLLVGVLQQQMGLSLIVLFETEKFILALEQPTETEMMVPIPYTKGCLQLTLLSVTDWDGLILSYNRKEF